MKYKSSFKLTASVKDVEAAKNYLLDATDEMSQMIKEDTENNKIISIKWILNDCSSGEIILETSEELTNSELDDIVDWVEGQISDGLGSGFSGQKFANYLDEGITGYEGSTWDDEWVLASFEWTRDKNKFELIK